MIKNTILLSSMILSLFSFNIYAQTEPSNNDGLVKKYFVGKLGYNRRIVKIYQKNVVARGSQQLVSNAPAEGLILFSDSKKRQLPSRKRIMNFRRHP